MCSLFYLQIKVLFRRFAKDSLSNQHGGNRKHEQRCFPVLQLSVQEGKQEGVRVLITTYKEFGVTYEAAAAGVKEKYSLDDTEVQRDMELYW